MLRKIYHKLIPFEQRYFLYKARNKNEFADLRTSIKPSNKGNFSIRKYDHYKVVFVHITKTAGTSVALSLFNELPFHYTASQYRVIFGRKDFNNYFKFAFVRNPWSRLYSAYNFLKKGGWDDNDKKWADDNLGCYDDFNDFVIDWLSEDKIHSHIHFWPQSRFICDEQGKCLINYIGYFEDIENDFNYVKNILRLDVPLEKKNRTGTKSYKEVYNEKSIEKVSSLYAEDIFNFGYTYDSFSRKITVNNKFYPKN